MSLHTGKYFKANVTPLPRICLSEKKFFLLPLVCAGLFIYVLLLGLDVAYILISDFLYRAEGFYMRSVWEILQPKEAAQEPLSRTHRYKKFESKSWPATHVHLS